MRRVLRRAARVRSPATGADRPASRRPHPRTGRSERPADHAARHRQGAACPAGSRPGSPRRTRPRRRRRSPRPRSPTPCTPCAAMPARRRVLVLDGAPGPWLPPGFDVVPQCAGGLDERLAAAFAGCDGPDPAHRHGHPAGHPATARSRAGLRRLGRLRRLVRPGRGRRLLGARPGRPRPRAAARRADVHARTGAVQRARLAAAGLRVRDLPRAAGRRHGRRRRARSRPLAPRGRFAADPGPADRRPPADEHRRCRRRRGRPPRHRHLGAPTPTPTRCAAGRGPLFLRRARRLAAAAGGRALVRRRRRGRPVRCCAGARAPSSTSAAAPGGWSPRSPRRAGRRSASTSARPPSPAPLRLGGPALRRSVFDPLPGEGRWGTALLLDGNIGIGGDPRALLAPDWRELRRPGRPVDRRDGPRRTSTNASRSASCAVPPHRHPARAGRPVPLGPGRRPRAAAARATRRLDARRPMDRHGPGRPDTGHRTLLRLPAPPVGPYALRP